MEIGFIVSERGIEGEGDRLDHLDTLRVQVGGKRHVELRPCRRARVGDAVRRGEKHLGADEASRAHLIVSVDYPVLVEVEEQRADTREIARARVRPIYVETWLCGCDARTLRRAFA